MFPDNRQGSGTGKFVRSGLYHWRISTKHSHRFEVNHKRNWSFGKLVKVLQSEHDLAWNLLTSEVLKERPRVSAGRRIYAVGDVHGRADLLA